MSYENARKFLRGFYSNPRKLNAIIDIYMGHMRQYQLAGQVPAEDIGIELRKTREVSFLVDEALDGLDTELALQIETGLIQSLTGS